MMSARVRDVDIRLTVGQALVRWLDAQWSERDGERRRAIPAVWGIFGHGNALGLGQALAGQEVHVPRNEQAMVHAALGFAKASRRLACHACTASIGPGATNLLTGAATATVNRLPVLLLPADTFATRRSGVVLQQLEHPLAGDVSVNDAFRAVSRYFDRVARPEQLLTALPNALRVLLDPAETGAVTVALHQDVLGEAYDWPVEFFDERVTVIARRPPAREELEAATALLREARRPLIIAGGGVRYSAAEAALAAFARETGIPVAETSAGKGVMEAGPLQLGGIGVNGTGAAAELALRADVVLCVGTRLTDFTTGSLTLFRDARLISINVCAADAVKLRALPVVADARLALEALSVAPVSAEYGNVVATARDRWRQTLANAPRTGGFTRAHVYAGVNAGARAGDWVVAAAGWAPGDLLKLWTVPSGGHAHLEFGFSCMGHELPAGLGIRMHEGPDSGEVYVIVGDGSLLIGAGELATLAAERAKLIVVVVDNGGYGSIDSLALDGAGVSVGNRFAGPDVDFAALAESLGCFGARAGDLEELERALGAARARSSTTVIHCRVREAEIPPSGAFWDLGVPEVAEDPVVRRRITHFRERRRAARRRRVP
jgi:3D-(3,5/4)-trihydroxycyclohexane-1,2-dione acylhydrolase (decyclizing)